jgi:nicotinamide mononucleotide (NMN) deamidase PncC
LNRKILSHSGQISKKTADELASEEMKKMQTNSPLSRA